MVDREYFLELGHPQCTIFILYTLSLDDSEPNAPHVTSFFGAWQIALSSDNV